MIKAVYDQIIVSIKYKDSKDGGSIYIPEDAQKRHADYECLVVDVGPDDKLGLSVGDKVLIDRFEGIELSQGFVALKPERILAKEW